VIATTNQGRILEFGGQLTSFPEKQSLVEEITIDNPVGPKEEVQAYRHLMSRSGKCLGVSENSDKPGLGVIAWGSFVPQRQRWKFDDGHLVNERGLCLAVSGNNARAGTGVCQWTRTSEDGQKWEMLPDGHIRNGHGKFLAISGNSSKDGATICHWDRSGEEGQIWQFVEE